MKRVVVLVLTLFLPDFVGHCAPQEQEGKEAGLVLTFDGPFAKGQSLPLRDDPKAFVAVGRVRFVEFCEGSPLLYVESFYRRDKGAEGRDRLLGVKMKIVATDLRGETRVVFENRYGADYVGPPAMSAGMRRTPIGFGNRQIVPLEKLAPGAIKKLEISFTQANSASGRPVQN